MKKYLILVVLVSLPLFVNSQPMSVRKAFHRYGKDEGVTKVTIPGIVMDFASWFVDDKETAKILRRVNKIKVLAAERSEGYTGPNIASEIMADFKKKSFTELMTVNSDKENVAILFREGRRNSEVLVIAGGIEDNAIVYLKGRLTMDMLSKIGKEMNIDPLEKLEL